MTPFAFHIANDRAEALALAADGARFVGGGTNLVDLLRQNVDSASQLVDVS
ncbi:MAG: xanthine dehydrogenase family protein subunit M, partial [Mesorhizobium sp.]